MDTQTLHVVELCQVILPVISIIAFIMDNLASRIRSLIEGKNNVINDLTNQLAVLTNTVGAQGVALNERDSTISELQQQLASQPNLEEASTVLSEQGY
jgi:hypothetical protein